MMISCECGKADDTDWYLLIIVIGVLVGLMTLYNDQVSTIR